MCSRRQRPRLSDLQPHSLWASGKQWKGRLLDPQEPPAGPGSLRMRPSSDLVHDVLQGRGWLCRAGRPRRRLLHILSPVQATGSALPGRGNAAVCVVSLLGNWRGFHLRLRAQRFYWGYSCGHPLPVQCQPQKEADACHKSHRLYEQSQLAHEQDLFTPGEFQKPGSQRPVRANLAGRPLCCQ